MNSKKNIDEVDVKILKILLEEPRTSFLEIAKKCNISNSGARVRFERLKERGVVTGSIIQINPKILGYNVIALNAIEADANEEEKVYSFLKEIEGTLLVVQYVGRYNFLSFVATKDTDELAYIIESMSSHTNIKKIKTNICIDITRIDYPENLIIKPSGMLHLDEEVRRKGKMEPTEAKPHSLDILEKKSEKDALRVDELDLEIIRLLSGDARMPFSKAAKRIGVSTQSVSRRYAKMRRGVLPFGSVTVNLERLGYEATAALMIRTTSRSIVSAVFNELIRIPNVIVGLRTLGTVDLWLLVPIASFEQLFEIQKMISSVQGVRRIDILLRKPFGSWPRNLFHEAF